MNFEVIILGNTSAIPSASKHHTSQLLNISNQYYLIDCGEGTQAQLRRAKIKFQRINNIFISHLHGDHYFGLVGLLSSMHLLGRKNDLNIYCHKELENIILSQVNMYGNELGYKVNFNQLNGKTTETILEDKHIIVKSFPLKHRIPCNGFLFKEKEREVNLKKDVVKDYEIPISQIKEIKQGKDFIDSDGMVIKNSRLTIPPISPKSYAYCSDTAFSKKVIDNIKGVNLLYHESTFLETHKNRAKETGHSTAKEAAQVAKEAGVDNLLIGHFSARYSDKQHFLNEAKVEFANTYLTDEGQSIEINREKNTILAIKRIF